jgi:hypothetical protein
MILPANEITFKRRVGRLNGRSVYHIGSIGGLHLIAAYNSDGSTETLGAGSHQSVAKYIAKKNTPDLVLDILEKSQEAAYEDFASVVPFWEQVTDKLRSKP